jgi:hypothetical protein
MHASPLEVDQTFWRRRLLANLELAIELVLELEVASTFLEHLEHEEECELFCYSTIPSATPWSDAVMRTLDGLSVHDDSQRLNDWLHCFSLLKYCPLMPWER